MDISSNTMSNVILRNMKEINENPHLRKLLEEMNNMREEIYGDKIQIEKKSEATPISEKSTLHIQKKPYTKRKRVSEENAAFRASYIKFGEIRKSDRLSGAPPKYKFDDDIDELENKTLYSNGKLKFVYGGIQRKSIVRHRQNMSDRIILKPEEITSEMLEKISRNANTKIYDAVNGTSCHQCRQKTRDTKTICRNPYCIGVRGQFCGPCAKNRYGVDAKEALLDPNWWCFVCQGVCNCSFCRSREGKRPTGILSHIAKREGYSSVKDFLDTLEIEIPEQERVLGFVDESTVLTPMGNEKLLHSEGAQFKAQILTQIIDGIENSSGFRGFDDTSIKESEVRSKKQYNL